MDLKEENIIVEENIIIEQNDEIEETINSGFDMNDVTMKFFNEQRKLL